MVRVPSMPRKQPATFHEAVRDWLESGPRPVRRRGSAGIGIGPALGREADPVPRLRPAASTMRSERPAPPRKT
jgi:hypothetical protein